MMDKKQEEIERYLQSDTWRELQNKRLKFDNYACALCGDTAKLAHRKYGEVNPWKESVNDLTSLCERCEANFLHPPSLVDIRKQVHARRLELDNTCPVCDQNVRERQVSLASREIAVMEELVLVATSDDFIDVRAERYSKLSTLVLRFPSVIGDLRTFDLIEEEGSNRSMYRPTEHGRRFLKGEAKVPRKVYVYNAEVIGSSNEDMIFIYEVIAK